MTDISAINISAATPAPKKGKPDPAAQLLEQLAAAGMKPEDVPKLRDQQAKLADTLDSLHAARKSLKQQLKEAAEQRIAFIKAQIDALKKMGAMADPKAAAREAASLAKQLAGAVRDYASGAAGVRAEEAVDGTAPPVAALVAEDAQFRGEITAMTNDLKNILALLRIIARDAKTGDAAFAFNDIANALSQLQASESDGSNSLNINA